MSGTDNYAHSSEQGLESRSYATAGAAHRSYYRWLHLRRLAMGAFFVMAVLFFLWLLPWMPGGLEADDYTPELAFTVYLLGGVAVTGLLTLAFQELARRGRESLMVWASVYDEATGIYNRAYLYDRLSLECQRAELSGVVFSVIVLQFRIGSSAPARRAQLSSAPIQEMAELVNHLTQRADLVALLSGSELAVVAIGVNRHNRHLLVERLRNATAASLAELLDESAISDVIGGVATYGLEGEEPEALIQAARAAVILRLPHRPGA